MRELLPVMDCPDCEDGIAGLVDEEDKELRENIIKSRTFICQECGLVIVLSRELDGRIYKNQGQRGKHGCDD